MASRKVTLRLPEELLDALRREAERRKIGYQTLIRILIAEGLERLGSKTEKPQKKNLHEMSDANPVAWRDFGAGRDLFWSSPEELPLWMVICTVLKAGRSKPLFALLERHGAEKIEHYLEMLRQEGEIRQEIYDYMRGWVERWKMLKK